MARSDDLLTVASAVLGVAVANLLIQVLNERFGTPVNRYQVGAATRTPASSVAEALEELADKGFIRATGDPEQPNHREYQLKQRVPLSA